LRKAKRGRAPLPAAVPPVPSISGDQSGGGDGGRPEDLHADVDSLGRSKVFSPAGVIGGARVRSRSRSPAVVVGRARFSREGVPLQCVLRGGVDEAMAAALRGIMLCLLLAPYGALLWSHRRLWELLRGNPGSDLHRLSGDVVLALLFQGCRMCCG
jgi:hypothetical protein